MIEEGVASDFRAQVILSAVGYSGMVILGAVVEQSTPESFADFDEAGSGFPFMLECQRVAGDFGYFLKVRVNDIPTSIDYIACNCLHYRAFVKSKASLF